QDTSEPPLLPTSTSRPAPDLATAALSEECGQSEVPAFRIVHGEESVPGRWPWMAAIFIQEEQNSTTFTFCGGSLIGPRHILTAAHCTKQHSLARGNKLNMLPHTWLNGTPYTLLYRLKKNNRYEEVKSRERGND
ncbi:hypothetical protein L9F63_024497, partial [Diploptera punctata]